MFLTIGDSYSFILFPTQEGSALWLSPGWKTSHLKTAWRVLRYTTLRQIAGQMDLNSLCRYVRWGSSNTMAQFMSWVSWMKGIGMHYIFTSRVSGRGNRIGPVCVCVCNSALSQLNRLTYGQEILHVGHPGSYLGQIRRSRSPDEKMWFPRNCTDLYSDLNGMIQNHGLWCDVSTSYDVTAWRHTVIWRHKMTSFLL